MRVADSSENDAFAVYRYNPFDISILGHQFFLNIREIAAIAQ
jgi:hypothetical protein